ncbi:mycothiol transferase [Nocardioides donggukensis]|uniref:DUF664 domain-containing protein n=1 Tax=Nocardioides donggukensis TaxID=2774019 RepID=A0A927K5B7_9ACTN|nr:DinB family protein [Nocardioides donggukensis]MBD8870562.1 DUF664 domain-containing protein [Nocardioides donggukensis]
MEPRHLLADAFGRIEELYADLAQGLDDTTLHHRPRGTGNSVGWLLWHLARVQDDHIAGLAGDKQAWQDGWRERFDLPFGDDIGYGHTSEQVDACRIEDPALLAGYHAEVHRRTMAYVDGLAADDLDRVVDEAWDPPVTVAVRLVSVEGDCLQHLGQAAYLKGLHS